MIWLVLILICFFVLSLSARLEELRLGHALAMAGLEARLRAAKTEPRVIVLQVGPKLAASNASEESDEGQDELRRYLNRIAKL